MEKLYYVICVKYRKFEKTLEKTLVNSIICSKCKNKDNKNIWRRRIHWNIKNSWFNWKYVITLKIWVENLD